MLRHSSWGFRISLWLHADIEEATTLFPVWKQCCFHVPSIIFQTPHWEPYSSQTAVVGQKDKSNDISKNWPFFFSLSLAYVFCLFIFNDKHTWEHELSASRDPVMSPGNDMQKVWRQLYYTALLKHRCKRIFMQQAYFIQLLPNSHTVTCSEDPLFSRAHNFFIWRIIF